MPSLGSIGRGPVTSSGLIIHTTSGSLQSIRCKRTPPVDDVGAEIIVGGGSVGKTVLGDAVVELGVVIMVVGGVAVLLPGGGIGGDVISPGAGVVGIVIFPGTGGLLVVVVAVVVDVVVGTSIGGGTPGTITIGGDVFAGNSPKHAVRSHRHI